MTRALPRGSSSFPWVSLLAILRARYSPGSEVRAIRCPNASILDELGFVPLSKTGAELLFEIISQRYERGSIIITSNLPFDEWSEVFGSERLTGAILDRLTHHVHILEMNGESFWLRQSRKTRT